MTKTILAIVFNIIFALLLIPSAMSAMMSPMMFDAPGSTESTLLWIAFTANFTFPIVIFVSLISSILFNISKKKDLALITSLLPFINIAFFFGAILMMN